LLVGASLAGLTWASRGTALAGFTVTPEPTPNKLVVIFLRGGADGLAILTPFFEDRYYKIRPNIALAEKDLVKLDGRFGLHPGLKPLENLVAQKRVLGIHAVGSFDRTRSHFEAMSAMERGLADDGAGPASGWLGRYLAASATPEQTPLRAVAFGSTMPDAFRGGLNSVSLDSISQYRLNGNAEERKQLVAQLRDLCSQDKDAASEAGLSTLRVLEALQALEMPKTRNGNLKYPETGLGNGLKETAMMIKGDVGMEVAFLNMGGWDTHVAQGSTVGWIHGLISELGQALAAFAEDLGPELDRTTIIVKSEFGRRVYENGGLGTDHGRAGAMLVLGGGLKRTGAYADWPTLEPDQLEDPGDLRVTTDYRTVLAELLHKRQGFADSATVFPGWNAGKSLGLFA
jgi:uncharacterized protein (DUF1501 family)